MKKIIRGTLPAALVLLLTTLLWTACGTREWPYSTIRVYVGWAAGGAADIVARSLVREMEPHLGQRIVVTNITGALGAIAGAQVAAAPADGNLWFGNAMVQGTWPVLDYTQVTWTDFYSFPAVMYPTTIYVRTDSRWENIQDLINEIRNSPRGTFKYGNPSRGSNGEIFAATLLEEAGVLELVESIPYDGGREAGRFLLGGDLDFVSVTLGDLSDWAVAGRVRPLANLHHRDVEFEGVVFPSVLEHFPSLEPMQAINPYFGISVRRETPPEIVTLIAEAFVEAVFQERFLQVAVDERAGVLSPSIGRASDEILSRIESARTWPLFHLEVGPNSPEKFGIPRLKEWSWPPHERARTAAPWPDEVEKLAVELAARSE